MFPLSAVVIGESENALAQIRVGLRQNDALVEGEFQDTTQAILSLNPTGGPRLHVIHVAREKHLNDIKAMVSQFPGQPILAVVDGEHPNLLVSGASAMVPYNHIESFSESKESVKTEVLTPKTGTSSMLIPAMRAGAMQVVTLPLDPEDFRDALECLAVHFGHPQESTVIAVADVLGGCGATTVSVNLAYELAYWSKRDCILAELALPMGRLSTYLNCKAPYTLGNLLESGYLDLYSLREVLYHYDQHLELLCSPYQELTAEDWRNDDTVHHRLLDVLDSLPRVAPLVVVTLPPTLDDLYFQAIARSDKVLLVAEQTLPAMHNLVRVQKVLEGELGISQYDVILNKYDPSLKGYSRAELANSLKINLRTISNEPDRLRTAMNEGCPLRQCEPKSVVLQEISQLAAQLAHINIPSNNSRGLLQWLFGKRS
jgi:Flp pilus assembly CpaE family ATPase